MIVSETEPEMVREPEAVNSRHVVPFFLMVQEFASMAFHDTVVELPITTRSGTAVMETVGKITFTVTTDESVEPPGPVHVI